MYASHAGAQLPYFNKALLKKEIVEAIKMRGPRYLLVQGLRSACPEVGLEVVPLLIPWLEDDNADARVGALEGLRLFMKTPDPSLFPQLTGRLKDSNSRVRGLASQLVGAYRDAAALEALKNVLNDPDEWVVSQTVAAVGWVATAARPGSLLRRGRSRHAAQNQ